MLEFNRGFSLIEMMITLVVIVVALGAAVPGFGDVTSRNRATTQVNEFLVAINLARSEALRVGNIVSLQATDPSDSSNEFGKGWCVVEGTPGNCNGTVIRSFTSLADASMFNSVEDLESIQFNAFGELDSGVAQNIDLCSSGKGDRRIRIAPIGRSKAYRDDNSIVSKRPDCV